MSKLTEISLSAEFVIRNAIPTSAELASGFSLGWIDQETLIDLLRFKLTSGYPLTVNEKRLIGVARGEDTSFETLIRNLGVSSEPSEQRARIWMFLTLEYALEHKTEFRDPFEILETLYADLEYPTEMRDLIRFLPPEPGQLIGIDQIEKRWIALVGQLRMEFRDRGGLT